MMTCNLKSCIVIARSACFNEKTKHAVPASVLSYVNMLSPEGALTGAYGENGIQALKQYLAKSLDFESLCQEIEFTVPRDVSSTTPVSMEMLSTKSTLNCLRLKARVYDTVNVFWRSLFLHSLPESEVDFPRTPTKHPEMIANLRKLPLFKHIDMFIYPVDLGDDGVLVVGSYFSPANVISISAKPSIPGTFKFVR